MGRVVLRWDGHHLIVTDRYGTSFEVPIPDRPRSTDLAFDVRLRALGELVWCSYAPQPQSRTHRSTLLMIDTDGNRFAELADPRFTRESVMTVSRAAGVPFRAYNLASAGSKYDELMNAMFPRKGRLFRLAD